MIGRVNSWKGQGDFLRAISPILYKNAEVYAFLVGGVFSEEGWRLSNLKREVWIEVRTIALKVVTLKNKK